MRFKPFGEAALNIYIHCWYIPLFAFLLGIKLCLISFLVDSITKVEHTRIYDEYVTYEMAKYSKTLKNKMDELKMAHELKLFEEQHKKHPKDIRSSSTTSTTTTTISPEMIREWKMLDDLENAAIEPSSKNRTDPNSIWLIFNRIPRAAGDSMVQLLYKLGESNGFNHQEHEYRTPWPRFLLEQEQENLVTWFEYQHLPKSYDRHFYFVNFTQYQRYVKERPIYINIVRDPIIRLKSLYRSRRVHPEIAKMEIDRRNQVDPGSGMIWYHRTFDECVESADDECSFETGNPYFTLMVPFFCGQHPACVLLNNKWALQRAKFTIEKYYSVVGVLERWNETLTALENYIPKFFSNATNAFYDNGAPRPGRAKKRMNKFLFGQIGSQTKHVSEGLRFLLGEKLQGEFELYRFINQRLTLQLSGNSSVD